MTKKDYKGGLNSLLGNQPKNEVTIKGTKVKTPAQKRRETIRSKWLKIKEDNDKIVVINQTGEQTEKLKVGRPKTQFKEILKTSQKGTKENEIRATFIINEDLLEKLKAIAYWERTLIKDVLDEAIQEAVSKYEKKIGEIKPIPKK